jgi:hypothetical protein
MTGSRLSIFFIFALTTLAVSGCDATRESRPPDVVAERHVAHRVVTTGVEVPGRRLAYTENRAACAVHNPQRSPYFGDVHVHTSRSLDAGIQDTRTTPYQAYLFAQGERIGIQPWTASNAEGGLGLAHMLPLEDPTRTPAIDATPLRSLQLGRPLDFAMVSDHAEFFGEVRICGERGVFERSMSFVKEGGLLNQGYLSQKCVNLRQDPLAQFISWNMAYLSRLPKTTLGDGIPRFSNLCGLNGETCRKAAWATWEEAIGAAEAAYDKTDDCEFTAFVGYEYTSTPLSDNMHRNVLFRNANVPEYPTSYMEAKNPELLWAKLGESCTEELGCEVITIPHNSNVSGNRMFRRSPALAGHSDFDTSYATSRQQYEPLVEIYQHKGDSECSMNNADEMCSFEKFPFNNLIADRFGGLLTSWPAEDNFVRYALKRGLQHEAELGVNPFKYGLIGSTDTHLGTPGAVNETNFPGHGGAGGSSNDLVVSDESTTVELKHPPTTLQTGLADSIAFSGGGLMAIWSEENSRDYLFDAMRRREVYGTSGPRMTLRLFGGWDYPADMCDDVSYDPSASALTQGDFVVTGYERGVPMGGDLTSAPSPGDKPIFAVAALKDPGFGVADELDEEEGDLFERSTPLQKLEIIKGWVSADGEVHEKVVAVAGQLGSSVRLDTCEPQGPGADSLCAVWRDDFFDPDQRAFYYARAAENPTCRWSWLQCTDWGRENDIEWEQSCSDPKSLPEGYQSCCKHESLSDLGRSKLNERLLGTYPETIQERAWSSPIWYRPGSG